MADPIADNAELAVDELKRKARRRLIGAIVLALAAATLLPLLLEQEQKPLGDDVSVQIPPVDESKFISRLAGDKGKNAQPEPKAGGGAAGKIDAKPEPRADPSPEPKPETKAEPKPEPRAEPKPEPKAEPKAERKSAASPEPVPAAADANSAPAVTESASAPADAKAAPGTATAAATAGAERPRAEGFIVQLGAFTDAYGANALTNKLKKAGYPAYSEPTATSRGTLWRVRVGGYPSRAAANEARDRLKADGQNGIVSAAK